MRRKVIILFLISILWCSIFGAFHANGNQQQPMHPQPQNIYINVATENTFWLSGASSSKEEWDNNINYSWVVDNQKYIIKTSRTDFTTLQNENELKKYDVLVDGGMQDEHIFGFGCAAGPSTATRPPGMSTSTCMRTSRGAGISPS